MKMEKGKWKIENGKWKIKGERIMRIEHKILIGIAIIIGLFIDIMPDWLVCVIAGLEIIGWCIYLIGWIEEDIKEREWKKTRK